ncbi:MAG: ribonuclease III [Chloroflexota bacterium]
MGKPQGSVQLVTPQELVNRLNLPITDISLINRAFTHRSYLNEHPEVLEDNERLEFLGDAVLELVVSVWLYNHFPEMPEGGLTRLRAALIWNKQLAAFARRLSLDKALRLGKGEEAAGGRQRTSLLSATMEAVVGALFLDCGLPAVIQFVENLLVDTSDELFVTDKDPKSHLQELVQGWHYPPPEYRVIATSGPDHEKEFEVEVIVDGEVWGRGKGPNKRSASKDAAKNVLSERGLI